MLSNNPEDWTEDYEVHGCYENSCPVCLEKFHGAKSRITCRQCYAGGYHVPNATNLSIIAKLQASIRKERAHVKKLEAGITQFPGQGHDRPCYYCGEKTNGLAGNPGLWPIPLCHADEPGKVKWHHSSCVTDRLVENQSRLEKVLRLEISNLKIDLQHANESLDAYRKGFDGAMKALE